jgi:SPP1 family predicted phage head-tail adaptor
MRAGNLRHRVTIQESTPTRNSKGEEIDSWSTFGGGARAAAVIPLAGREAFNARQRHAEAELRIELRHLAGVTTKMRVSYDGRLFDILDVADIEERGRETHLLVKERK